MSGVSRRGFLRGGVGAAGGLAALAASLLPLKDLDADGFTLEKLLQKHYLRMTPAELARVLERIEAEVQARTGVAVEVGDRKPLTGVEFVYVLDLGRCIGCRRCVHACAEENNLGLDPEVQYIRVLEMPRGSLDVRRGDHHYDRARVPDARHYYMPIQCQQCEDPPCVAVCPVGATWQEPDGVTVVDYDWCIGCRFCEAACPYWARRFNFVAPNVPRERLNPDMNYLSNRPRPAGVVEKCHFCLHRTRAGLLPACLEACPAGARLFGNILDPDSDVARILAEKQVFVLKQEAGTSPRFFYVFEADDGIAGESGG